MIELASLGPAPYACLLLAELGAEVIRIDRPGGAGMPGVRRDALNRSRPSLTVDLKAPGAIGLVLRLARSADVVVEGWRPGVAERLGLGPDACQFENEGLVYARMTGWGQDGPLAHRAGHDINYSALSGALHAIGGPERPRQALNLIADFGGGSLFLVVGVLAALAERSRSGRGQVIDAAMVDGAASLMTMIYGMHATGSWRDERGVNLLDGGAPFYDTYRCRDDRFVAVGAIEPQFFAELLAGLGLSEAGLVQYDETGWTHMREIFTTTFLSRSRDEWMRVFDGTDACVSPVLSLAEAPHHPHAVARSSFREFDSGFQPAAAPRFSRTPRLPPGTISQAGSDSWRILSEIGLSEGEIGELVRGGVISR